MQRVGKSLGNANKMLAVDGGRASWHSSTTACVRRAWGFRAYRRATLRVRALFNSPTQTLEGCIVQRGHMSGIDVFCTLNLLTCQHYKCTDLTTLWMYRLGDSSVRKAMFYFLFHGYILFPWIKVNFVLKTALCSLELTILVAMAIRKYGRLAILPYQSCPMKAVKKK